MDWWALAKDLGIPAVGGLVGYLSSAKLAAHRLKTVEDDLKEYRTLQKVELESIKKALKFDLEAHKGEVQDKLKELKNQIDELEDVVESFQRASNHEFAKDAELNKFIEEQQRLWQSIQRTLGQIEGMMGKLK